MQQATSLVCAPGTWLVLRVASCVPVSCLRSSDGVQACCYVTLLKALHLQGAGLPERHAPERGSKVSGHGMHARPLSLSRASIKCKKRGRGGAGQDLHGG